MPADASRVQRQVDRDSGAAFKIAVDGDASPMALRHLFHERLAAVPSRVEGDIQRSCKLWTEKEALEAIAHDSGPLIALLFATGPQCELDVTRAVALVQILQSMAKAIVQKS
jgi:hypothetical protein